MDTYTTTLDPAQQQALAGMMTAYYVVAIIVCIFYVVCMWKIFSKAGEAGWKSIVPFLNNYTEFKIAWGNGWLFLLCFVPIVNVVVSIILFVKLAKAFGKGGGFAAGLIFLPVIFLPILAFGSAQYIGPQN